VVNLKEMALTSNGHLYAEVTRNLFALEVESNDEENQSYDKKVKGGNQGK